MVPRDDFSYVDELISRVLSFNSELKQTTPVDDRSLVKVVGSCAEFYIFQFEATPPFSGCKTRIRCSLKLSASSKLYVFFLRGTLWTNENSSKPILDDFMSSLFSLPVVSNDKDYSTQKTL